MRITAAHITNFKRIESVRITPGADRTIILLGGRNGQGKSSTLDALTAAFGGKKLQPADPVRHGAAEAEIRVELDDGDLTIRRVIQPDGESVLEVRDRLGAMKSPQAVLDKLIGARFLDPLQFLALPAKEQRAQLMRLIGEAQRIAELDGKRERAFTKRTEVGRDLTRAEGELARLPAVEPGTPIDVAELTAEAKRIAELEREGAILQRTREQCERETIQARAKLSSIVAERQKLEAEIERLKARVVELGVQSANWAKDAETCEAKEREATAKVDEFTDRLEALRPRREEIDADLARADQHNRTVYAAQAQGQRRAEVAETVAKLQAERDAITKTIAVIDGRKAEILAAAKLPVEGLGLDDDGITLGGVPFAQASGAERFRVALALAIAASPGLDDVWVRDAALLDGENVSLIQEQAAAAGKRVWLERVGTNDPEVIVISDGRVAS